ncbi:DUF5047 domain-containing protein [Streptomyces sp. DT18]
MYPVSPRFLARLAEAHRPVVRAQLFLTTGKVIDLEVTGGSVQVDRAQAIRRTCTVTVPDPSLIPRTPSDQLATYGARLRLERGVEYGDGSQELVPLGVFRLDSVDGDVAQGPVTLQGKSLECVVQSDLATTTWGTVGTVQASISAIIQHSLPDASIISRIDPVTVGSRQFDVEADLWAGAQEIAAAVGAEVFADANGAFVIATMPDLLTSDPVWAVEAGEGGVYVSGSRAMTSDNVFNGVLARGENTSDDVAPVSWLAVDDDPGSPTYWDGPFGHRPTVYSSSTLTTTALCRQAAQLRLAQAKAPNSSGDISSLPNPALEPGDVIRVTHPDGTRELHQIASFTVPLDLGGDFPISTISAKEDS